jgi:hypothetical protein
VTPELRFRQYLSRIDQPRGNLASQVLERRGAELEFRITATGYKGAKLGLRWQLLDGAGDKVGEEHATTLVPQADTDRIAWQAFLPYPSGRRGPFVGTVDLLDPKGVPLDRLHHALRPKLRA